MRSRLLPVAALFASLVCAPAAAQNGPASLWRLDDGAGAVAADSAGTSPGAVSGGAAWIAGVAGGALSFDGVDDAVTFPETFPFHRPGNATLMLWIRWDDDVHRAVIWSRDGNGEPDANRFHLFSGYLHFLACNEGNGIGFDYREENGNLHPLLCAPGLPAGVWTHVAITRRTVPADFTRGDTYPVDVYALYVNGAKVAEAVDSAPALPTYTGPWTAGTRDGFMFSGALDEIALYPRALAPGEVAERYQRSLQGLPYEAPAPPTCTSWELAREFRLPPGQANPGPDRCGNPVWRFEYAPDGSPAVAGDPATYLPLQQFVKDWSWYSGLAGWYAAADTLPMVGLNGSGGSAFVPWWVPYEWLAGTVIVHPGPTQPTIVAFRAPLAGTVEVVEARFLNVDGWCGDGVDWAVQHGAAILGSGVAPPRVPATFSGAVEVAAGDVLYARVGPNGYGNHCADSTQLDLRLRQLSVVVAIDVVPGSAVNPITRSSRGTVPAAILGAPGFDAASVDPATLVLAGAPVAVLGGAPRAALEDVNGDGRLDLVAHFPVPGMTLPLGTTELALTGALGDGTQLRGTDAVRVQR